MVRWYAEKTGASLNRKMGSGAIQLYQPNSANSETVKQSNSETVKQYILFSKYVCMLLLRYTFTGDMRRLCVFMLSCLLVLANANQRVAHARLHLPV